MGEQAKEPIANAEIENPDALAIIGHHHSSPAKCFTSREPSPVHFASRPIENVTPDTMFAENQVLAAFELIISRKPDREQRDNQKSEVDPMAKMIHALVQMRNERVITAGNM